MQLYYYSSQEGIPAQKIALSFLYMCDYLHLYVLPVHDSHMFSSLLPEYLYHEGIS